jgi:hypothetical protein
MMIRRNAETGLTLWIERARASLVASLASVRCERRSSRPNSNYATLVERTDRTSDHAPQAPETPTVWTWQDRPASGQIDRRRMNELYQHCVSANFACRITGKNGPGQGDRPASSDAHATRIGPQASCALWVILQPELSEDDDKTSRLRSIRPPAGHPPHGLPLRALTRRRLSAATRRSRTIQE